MREKPECRAKHLNCSLYNREGYTYRYYEIYGKIFIRRAALSERYLRKINVIASVEEGKEWIMIIMIKRAEWYWATQHVPVTVLSILPEFFNLILRTAIWHKHFNKLLFVEEFKLRIRSMFRVPILITSWVKILMLDKFYCLHLCKRLCKSWPKEIQISTMAMSKDIENKICIWNKYIFRD